MRSVQALNSFFFFLLLLVFKMQCGPKSRFEMYFLSDPSTDRLKVLGVPMKTRLESRMKKFTLHLLYRPLPSAKTKVYPPSLVLYRPLPSAKTKVLRTARHPHIIVIKMAQHLHSRCVLLPAPLVPGVPTKTRLKSRFCNEEA